MSIIRLTDITHAYGAKQVLQQLSLDIGASQLTCLLGGSGSGKTTILRLIAGLEAPQSGCITISNNKVTDNKHIIIPPHQRHLGFIFQDLALWPHFTVYKNITFGLTARKQKNVKESVQQMLDYFGLQEYSDKYPHQLSGGQQQLVALSRALVLRPKILLMDEPLANLDVKLKRKTLDLIKKLQHNFDLSIVFVTHDHREAFVIADNIVILNKGIIEQAGSVEQIKNSENEFVKYFIEY